MRDSGVNPQKRGSLLPHLHAGQYETGKTWVGNVKQLEKHLFLRAGLVLELEDGLPEDPRLDSVDTIWQCTVPSSSMRHMGPNTSLALAPGTSE